MKLINGISFQNWVAACAHFNEGLTEKEVVTILEIELPVWHDTHEKWQRFYDNQVQHNWSMYHQFTAIYQNPKVGKFANTNAVNKGKKIDFNVSLYHKILWHQCIAAEVGIDTESVLKTYNLNLREWVALTTQFSKIALQLSKHSQSEKHTKFYKAVDIANQKWQQYWRNHYKGYAVNLASDIKF